VFIAEGKDSPTVASMLLETEAAIRQAELDLAAVRSRAEEEPALPSPEAITEAATDIATNCMKDPVKVRERLRGVLPDGKIVLEPQADGTFMARYNLLRDHGPCGGGSVILPPASKNCFRLYQYRSRLSSCSPTRP
jgi:hypothetical protein